MDSLLNETKPSIPLETVLPEDLTRRLRSLYDYLDRSILYPLRMAKDKSKAKEEYNRLLPKYQKLRNSVNILLLDALDEDSLENMYSGIERQVEKISDKSDLLNSSRKEKLTSSFRESVGLSQLIFEAASNTFGAEEDQKSLASFPETRIDDIKKLGDLIGKWELAFTAGYTAFLNSQGKKEVIDFLIEKAQRMSAKAEEKAEEFVGRCPVCKNPYIMKRTNQKYCSKSCLSKARNRRYRSKKTER